MKKLVMVILILFCLLTSCSKKDNFEINYEFGSETVYIGNAKPKSLVYCINTDKEKYDNKDLINMSIKINYLKLANKDFELSIMDNDYFDIINKEFSNSEELYELKLQLKAKKNSNGVKKFKVQFNGVNDDNRNIFSRDSNKITYLECSIYFIIDEFGCCFGGLKDASNTKNTYRSNIFFYQHRLNSLFNEGLINKEEYLNRMFNYNEYFFGYYISPNLSFKIDFTNGRYENFKYFLNSEEYLYLSYETNHLTLDEYNKALKNYYSLIYNYDYLFCYVDLLPFELEINEIKDILSSENLFINDFLIIDGKIYGLINKNYEYDFIFEYNKNPFGLSEDFQWEVYH